MKKTFLLLFAFLIIGTSATFSQDTKAIKKGVTSKLGHNPPRDSSCCVCMNADRSSIDTGTFANKLAHSQSTNDTSDFVVIRASNLRRKPKKGKLIPMSDEDKKYVFENCGDNRLKTNAGSSSGHFVDPMLKLYRNIPLMLLANTDVPNGYANGTRVILQSIVLNDGSTHGTAVVDGVDCKLIEASDVKYLVCTKADDKDKIFKIEPQNMTCRVNAPVPKIFGASSNSTINFTMALQQLPLIANNATTGHKLQGQTKKNLVVSVWSNRSNWNYVALSRVKTRNGLFLAQPLPCDVDFSMHADLRKMLDNFQSLVPADVHFDIEEEELLWTNRANHIVNYENVV